MYLNVKFWSQMISGGFNRDFLLNYFFLLFPSELFDLKTKYDESDNLMIRATRTFTDKVTDIFGKF